jgi:hypothetical protein
MYLQEQTGKVADATTWCLSLLQPGPELNKNTDANIFELQTFVSLQSR